MTFALQKKGIDGNADKSGEQRRSEVIPQMRDLYAPAEPSFQRILG
jgi:hypothetical protein